MNSTTKLAVTIIMEMNNGSFSISADSSDQRTEASYTKTYIYKMCALLCFVLCELKQIDNTEFERGRPISGERTHQTKSSHPTQNKSHRAEWPASDT